MKTRRLTLDPTAPGFREGLDRRFRVVEDLLDDVSDVPLLDSVLVADIELLDNVERDVRHGLERAWRGWFVVNLEGASTTGRIVRLPGEDRSKFLRLRANGWGATITVSLVVF